MNLYRSFGNIMEAWVNEGGLYPDSPTPSSDMGANFRSDSLDSGVETASSDTFFPATSSFLSSDNAELEAFIPDIQSTAASTSQSPVLSCASSSPRLCPSRPQDSPSALHLKLEQARQRAESKYRRDNPELLIVDELVGQQARASILPKRHTSELLRGQRSESVALRRTANSSALFRKMPEMCRRPMSLRLDRQRSEEEESEGLSPGLCYLEQVCQMLEDVARQQMQSRASQKNFSVLREHQDMQGLDSCQTDSAAAAEEELASCQCPVNREIEERSSRNSQQLDDNLYRHYRQRSVSDTTLATLHLRQLKSDCRGQHLSTDALAERPEEDSLTEESKNEESNNTDKSWRQKIASIRRDVSSLRGLPTQSSEKSSARRRLSQLFRRRRRTTAI